MTCYFEVLGFCVVEQDLQEDYCVGGIVKKIIVSLVDFSMGIVFDILFNKVQGAGLRKCVKRTVFDEYSFNQIF